VNPIEMMSGCVGMVCGLGAPIYWAVEDTVDAFDGYIFAATCELDSRFVSWPFLSVVSRSV
jgi:hypothetical protein